ncbi:hypothetical protein AB0I28_29720 [Phytomonospora sp. NPDC050363]|uniref:hypothetical protein n=1 Tax=Phytomonospora sp. NPDC050363 TaxID=3155642 RepID=UPI0033E43B61
MNDIIGKAETYLWRSGRVLEQLHFGHLFRGGSADAVRTALDAYRAADGGYAYGMEPDVRGPESQPATLRSALDVLASVGRLDRSTALPILDWLTTVTAPDGGVPAVLPSLRKYPRPTWLPIPDEPRGQLLPTAEIVGHMLGGGIDHPWLAPAAEFCRRTVAELRESHPYEIEAAVTYLDGLLDRGQALAAAAGLGRFVRDQRHVALDPLDPADAYLASGYAPGEHHYAYDYAPTPDSVAAAWFTPSEMDAALDFLGAEQRDDGGWPIGWARWSPTTEFEARPGATVRALRILRAWGRL